MVTPDIFSYHVEILDHNSLGRSIHPSNLVDLALVFALHDAYSVAGSNVDVLSPQVLRNRRRVHCLRA